MNECSICESGLYLFEDENNNKYCGECILSDGYVIYGTYCVKCHESCRTCDGPNRD